MLLGGLGALSCLQPLLHRNIIEEFEPNQDQHAQDSGDDQIAGLVRILTAAVGHVLYSLPGEGLGRLGVRLGGLDSPFSKAGRSLISAFWRSSSKAAQGASGAACRATKT